MFESLRSRQPLPEDEVPYIVIFDGDEGEQGVLPPDFDTQGVLEKAIGQMEAENQAWRNAGSPELDVDAFMAKADSYDASQLQD